MGRERATNNFSPATHLLLRSRETTLATKNLETYFWHAASLPHGRVTCTECYARLDAVIGAVWAVNGRQTASQLLLISEKPLWRPKILKHTSGMLRLCHTGEQHALSAMLVLML